ncbi:MAG: glycosyltransferase involved in cell wall biosynthesis [Bacteroidia bacterium]|jgi:glycosyltransferase involved in cell wall biosynthesis
MASSVDLEKYRSELKQMRVCVIVPTYNNHKTVARVIESVLEYSNDVIVVNDGATDNTQEILNQFKDKIYRIGYSPNRGKGYALRMGFQKALDLGYHYAITIDSDGQHFANDIPKFLEVHKTHPDAVIMGARNLEAEGMPAKNGFANRFSNFWFRLQTGIYMPDTQTGFRLYPLKKIANINFFTTRFEFEIEVIVKLAWRDVPFVSVPIQVTYDPEERVSHFRPGPDFTRISFLNAWFTILTAVYHLPRRLLLKGKLLQLIKEEAIKPEETNIRKAASIGFGFFMGVLPIWGFQLLVGIPTSIFLRMNKVLFITAANISLPPLIPFIIFFSYLMGQPFFDNEMITYDQIDEMTLDNIHDNFMQYATGGVILSLAMGLLGFLTSWGALAVLRKESKTTHSS